MTDKLPTDITVNVRAVAGKSLLNFGQLDNLQKGDILKLDHKITEPIDIYANNALVAKGRVVVIDNKLGVVITELTSNGFC